MEDLIKCSFGISSTEYRILRFLFGKGRKDIRSLSEDLDLERSTVQKSLNNLADRNLVKKRQMNLSSGGYKYVYESKDKEKIKDRVLELVNKWSKSSKKALEKW